MATKKCAICDHPKVQLHHRHYRDVQGEEPDRTLVPLCDACHIPIVHRLHRTWFEGDEWPYRWLSLVTTLSIVTHRSHRFVRRPGVVAVGFTAAYWWAGWWLPILGLTAMALVHFIRKRPLWGKPERTNGR